MIISTFKYGKGKSGPALKYLLGNDKENKPREPKPEIIAGDLNITKVMIDSNHRQHKYTSGVIAFRDEEHPTEQQIDEIIKTFEKCFTPGTERLPMLWIKHQDKGNTELHFLAPMQDTKTFKQCNICPPGQKIQQMYRDFQAICNYKNGWQQVRASLFKSQMNELDRLEPTDIKTRLKNAISGDLEELAKTGKMNNREQLIDYLKSKGLQVTRAGKDYISVKHPKATKATRLRGPAFTLTANYQELLQQQAPINTAEEKELYKATYSRFSSSVKNRLQSFKRTLDNIKPEQPQQPVDDSGGDGGSSGGDILLSINTELIKQEHKEQQQSTSDLSHFPNQRLKK